MEDTNKLITLIARHHAQRRELPAANNSDAAVPEFVKPFHFFETAKLLLVQAGKIFKEDFQGSDPSFAGF